MSELDEYWRNCKDQTSIYLGKPFPIAPNDLPGYCKLRMVSSGGQGRVYSAIALANGQKVAIKFYDGKLDNGKTDDECKNELLIQRFKAESNILQKLNHPQLPRCLEVGDYHGRPYYVMEWLKQFSFHDLLVFDDGKNDEPLAEFLLGLLDVVEYLHQHGIIHQDIKPENICWKDGKPALIDLGLVYDKSMETYTLEERQIMLTQASGGSYGFCAPEQIFGKLKDITVRADIFAIGSLINACLRGWNLPLFKQIAATCLNAHPAYRYKSIKELRFAIANRHRLAIFDVKIWSVNEIKRQIRLADCKESTIKRDFSELVMESCKYCDEVCKYYDEVITNFGLDLECKLYGQEKNVIWYPLIVNRGKVTIEEAMWIDKSVVIHVMGFGTLEMDFTGSSKVVVVLDRGVRLVNRSTGMDSNETYFINDGCELLLPNVCKCDEWKKKHLVFRSIYMRPLVSFGTQNREDMIKKVNTYWRHFVAKHRELSEVLRDICNLNIGLPILDITFGELRIRNDELGTVWRRFLAGNTDNAEVNEKLGCKQKV